MAPLIYPAGDERSTFYLGLATWGMDEVLANNMITLDTAIGAGSATHINGAVISNPNFVNSASVTFSVIGSNVSATASGSGSSVWSALTGDLTETQVIPFDGPTIGIADTGISRIGAASLAIGNGTSGSFTGSLKLNSITYVSSAPSQSSIAILSPSTNDGQIIIRNDGTLGGFDNLSNDRIIRAEGNFEITRNLDLNLATSTWNRDDVTIQGQIIEWGHSGFQIYVVPPGANPAVPEECCAWYDVGAGPREEHFVTTYFDPGAPVIFSDNAYCDGLLKLASTTPVSWSSTTNAASTNDTGISRDAAGVLDIGNGTQGSMTG